MPGFSVPEVDANPDGWGPTTVPEQLDGIPYAPFGKGDKVGRVSDFTNSGFNKYGGALFVMSVTTPTPFLSRCCTSSPLTVPHCPAADAHFPHAGRGFQQNREPGIAVFNFFANDEVRCWPCAAVIYLTQPQLYDGRHATEVLHGLEY